MWNHGTDELSLSWALPAQDVPGWLLRQQPPSHQTGEEDSQHLSPLSPILSINSGVFLLKPRQIRAAPYSLILDLGSKSGSNSFPLRCERVVEFQLWHVSCARAHHMVLGLLLWSCRRTDDTWSVLSLPGQNYPVKIFLTNLKQRYELVPVLHLMMCGLSSFSWLLEAEELS